MVYKKKVASESEGGGIWGLRKSLKVAQVVARSKAKNKTLKLASTTPHHRIPRHETCQQQCPGLFPCLRHRQPFRVLSFPLPTETFALQIIDLQIFGQGPNAVQILP
jgi:hypothetical protein